MTADYLDESGPRISPPSALRVPAVYTIIQLALQGGGYCMRNTMNIFSVSQHCGEEGSLGSTYYYTSHTAVQQHLLSHNYTYYYYCCITGRQPSASKYNSNILSCSMKCAICSSSRAPHVVRYNTPHVFLQQVRNFVSYISSVFSWLFFFSFLQFFISPPASDCFKTLKKQENNEE